MKARSVINISEADMYEEEDLYIFKQLISKLMYLAFGTRPDIAFAVS